MSEAEADPGLARILAAPRGGPTVLRIALGAQLRRLRESRGITPHRAGETIRASHAKISRLELGRVGSKSRDVADLLTLYGVHDPGEREAILSLAAQANTPGWWHRYSDVLPPWFETYIGLEQAATVIRNYEPQFVPGLLQTPAYARAIIQLGHADVPPAELDRRVALRTTRQDVLTQPEPPVLWAILDETALRRPQGGAKVMREQVRHLIDMAEQPQVTLQVVPAHLGGYAAVGGPFTILRFPEPDLPDIVYLEQLTSALYLDKVEDVDHYIAVLSRLTLQAPSPSETVKRLAEILDEL